MTSFPHVSKVPLPSLAAYRHAVLIDASAYAGTGGLAAGITSRAAGVDSAINVPLHQS